jgi:hypothetical protein
MDFINNSILQVIITITITTQEQQRQRQTKNVSAPRNFDLLRRGAKVAIGVADERHVVRLKFAHCRATHSKLGTGRLGIVKLVEIRPVLVWCGVVGVGVG